MTAYGNAHDDQDDAAVRANGLTGAGSLLVMPARLNPNDTRCPDAVVPKKRHVFAAFIRCARPVEWSSSVRKSSGIFTRRRPASWHPCDCSDMLRFDADRAMRIRAARRKSSYFDSLELNLMRSLFVLGLVLLAANVALGQKIEVIEFSGSGKLVSFVPGSLVFVDAQGKKHQVKFAKTGEMQVTLKPPKGPPQPIVAGPPTIDIAGELAPEQIRPGLTVVLTCVLDANRKSAVPATEIKVQDAKADAAGVFPEGQPNDSGQPVLIKGIAKSFKKGELTISVPKGDLAPKGTVSVTVADDAKVTFESHNPAMAAPGSMVEVKGTQLGKGGEIAATTITIKLPAPPPRKEKKRSAKAPNEKSPKADGDKSPDAAAEAEKPAEEGDAEKPGEGATPEGPKKRTKPGKLVPLGQSLPPAP
jgi:hypothetical protein